MPERRVPTLAEARRQVWVREGLGLLLIGLSVIFLLLVLVKWEADLRRAIDAFLLNWPMLAPLWRAIPPRHPIIGIPTTAMWDYVYALWGAVVVSGIGVWLRWSAHKRRAQITEFRQEMQREAWREQARAARGVATDDRGATTVIGQAIWYQYAAPPEPWSQTTRGILILGLIVGLVVGLILLYAEYWYFQPRWPSNRN